MREASGQKRRLPERCESEDSGLPVWETSEKALAILQAARKVFFEYGFFAATTDMIQREAKVSKSTLYQYFKNKEGMFGAVIRWTCRHHIENARLEPVTGDTLRERLTSIAASYLGLLLQDESIALFRIIIEVSRCFPHLSELFYGTGPAAFHKAVQQVLAQAVEDGELRLSDNEIVPASLLFVSMVRGEPFLLHLLFPHKYFSQEEVDGWIARAVDGFLAAYGVDSR